MSLDGARARPATADGGWLTCAARATARSARRGVAAAEPGCFLSAMTSGITEAPRGVPCWIGLKVPEPLSDRPADLARDLRGLARLNERVLAGLEIRHLDLAPEHVDPGVSPCPTVTRNCVPFTTAARYGVSTWKCLTLRFSTSSRIEPAC